MKFLEEIQLSSFVHGILVCFASFGWLYFSVTLLLELNYFDYVQSVFLLLDDLEKNLSITNTVKIISATSLTLLLLLIFITVPLIAIACLNVVWDKLGLIKILE